MIIRDSIHKDILINEEIIEKLIRTKEFQRLRRIKQLGLSNIIYPSAEHTRYSHSIGVYHLAKTFSEILEDKMGVKFDSKDKKSFHVACLLHDLGHGPFSHAAEQFFNYDHEEYTVKIIKHKDTQINKVLVENDCLDDVVAFIEKNHKNKILVSLLSSSVDVDRMDYLNRDAHNCGVSYGQFDLDRMKKIINVDLEEERVVFEQHSIHTIEDFLISRYHMFTQVYLNDKSIGYEALVGEILGHIRKLKEKGYEFKSDVIHILNKFYVETIDVLDFIDMDDCTLYYILQELSNKESDEKLISLIEVLLSFKELKISYEKDDTTLGKYRWKSDAYVKRVYSKQKPIYIRLDDGKISRLEEQSMLVDFVGDKLKIDVPKMYFGIKDEN